MNYKKLTQKLILGCVNYQDPLPMMLVLPSHIDVSNDLVTLTQEEGGPNFEEFLQHCVDKYSVIVESHLSEGDL